MEMTLESKFKFIKFKNYEVDSREWHVMKDIQEVKGNDDRFTIEAMVKLFGTDLKYYQCYMAVLIEDGCVEYDINN